MEQTVVPLTEDFIEHNEKQRVWVKEHFTDNADAKYAPLEGKLRLLDTIVREKWIEPNETWKLQALGIALGDAFAQKLGLEWVTVEDEYGRSPAVRYPNTSVIAFPLTMISKRIERGEDVDVREMFDGICDMITKRVADGNAA